MKKFLKEILPTRLIVFLNTLRFKFMYKKYETYDNAKVFTKIYKNKLWNKNSNLTFDSGTGSHEEYIVDKYVDVINKFLLENKVSVVDIGCGDFNIASKFYLNCKKYFGVNVVEDLINHLLIFLTKQKKKY